MRHLDHGKPLCFVPNDAMRDAKEGEMAALWCMIQSLCPHFRGEARKKIRFLSPKIVFPGRKKAGKFWRENLSVSKKGGMMEASAGQLPVHVPEDVLKANPKFAALIAVLATTKVRPNGVSINQHEEYERVRDLC